MEPWQKAERLVVCALSDEEGRLKIQGRLPRFISRLGSYAQLLYWMSDSNLVEEKKEKKKPPYI